MNMGVPVMVRNNHKSYGDKWDKLGDKTIHRESGPVGCRLF